MPQIKHIPRHEIEKQLEEANKKISDLLESHEFFISEKYRIKDFIPPHELNELLSRSCSNCDEEYHCNIKITASEMFLSYSPDTFNCSDWEKKND